MHFALRFTYIMYHIVLMPIYKRKSNQSDRIDNKFDIFIDNRYYSYDK